MIIGRVPQPLFWQPRAACSGPFQPQPMGGLEKQMETMRLMKEVQTALGRVSPKVEAGIRALEEKTRLAAEPPRQFSAETHAQVAAYLHEGGPLPSELSEQDHAHLANFRALVEQGIQLVDPPFQIYQTGKDQVGFTERKRFEPIAPECAFLQLIAYKHHGPEKEIHYCQVSADQVMTSTLRPAYLAGLEFFLRQVQAGHQFFVKTEKEGWKPVEQANEFTEAYHADPEGAFVRRPEGSLSLAEATRAVEKGEDGLYVPFREAGAKPASDQVGVGRRGEDLVVGGVLLRRKKK